VLNARQSLVHVLLLILLLLLLPITKEKSFSMRDVCVCVFDDGIKIRTYVHLEKELISYAQIFTHSGSGSGLNGLNAIGLFSVQHRGPVPLAYHSIVVGVW